MRDEQEKQQGPVHCWRGLGFAALGLPQAQTPRPADGGRGGTGEVQRAKVHGAVHAVRVARLSIGVLSDAVAERPVLFFHFHQIDEHVFEANRQVRVEVLRDGLVQRFFLLQRSAFVERDLDDHQLLGTLDAKVLGVKDEVIGVVLVEDLEVVMIRDVDGAAHGAVNLLADAFDKGRIGVFFDFDAD
jgi:hypothetical protein